MGIFKSDQYYIVYHRRLIGLTDRNHRVTCIDKIEFNEKGFILPVKITFEGVETNPLKETHDRHLASILGQYQ